jgi:hypothetical protein
MPSGRRTMQAYETHGRVQAIRPVEALEYCRQYSGPECLLYDEGQRRLAASYKDKLLNEGACGGITIPYERMGKLHGLERTEPAEALQYLTNERESHKGLNGQSL